MFQDVMVSDCQWILNIIVDGAIWSAVTDNNI